jgi:tetratricopeptide (TPR) repeat protein
MKTTLALFSLTLGLIGSAARAADIVWAKDIASASAKAAKSNKLVLAIFLKAGQEVSKQFEEITLKNDSIAKAIQADTVPVRLDPDKNGKSAAAKYKVKEFPTVLYLTAGGKELVQLHGPLPPMLFADEHKKAVSVGKEWPVIEKEFKAKPKDGEVNARMAWGLAIMRQRADAERHLTSAKKAGYKGIWLARALNMIGDIYQLNDQFALALDYFNKADASTLNTRDKSYAKVSIMSCYLSMNNLAKAKVTAQQLVDLKGADPDYVKFAKQVLAAPIRT